MKLVFEGSPDQVLKEMREYIARAAMEFGDQEIIPAREHSQVSATQNLTKIPDREPDPIEAMHPRCREKYDAKGIVITEEKLSGESQAQTTLKDPVCSFCAKYTNVSKPRVSNHEKHCKLNPNRIPHPKEGKPMNPALKAWQDRQREAKNLLPKESPDFLD